MEDCMNFIYYLKGGDGRDETMNAIGNRGSGGSAVENSMHLSYIRECIEKLDIAVHFAIGYFTQCYLQIPYRRLALPNAKTFCLKVGSLNTASNIASDTAAIGSSDASALICSCTQLR
ncbi:hypothetical protein Ddye_007172 [Dipteronia dyeriana]|uniref:Uncharacterized protein n=1 Tax=Dipteronia dyeriana TaxID=168575 RepID=A0AAE0CRE3_9ROSI|nr:hypothetical protein Ddye_007172 [Dipteronia dyeriana]